MFELFIARRYLRAKRKQVVISVITAISVIGVAAGVMALVIALAINNGFRDTLRTQSAGRDRARLDSGKGTRDGHRELGTAGCATGADPAREERGPRAL